MEDEVLTDPQIIQRHQQFSRTSQFPEHWSLMCLPLQKAQYRTIKMYSHAVSPATHLLHTNFDTCEAKLIRCEALAESTVFMPGGLVALLLAAVLVDVASLAVVRLAVATLAVRLLAIEILNEVLLVLAMLSVVLLSLIVLSLAMLEDISGAKLQL